VRASTCKSPLHLPFSNASFNILESERDTQRRLRGVRPTVGREQVISEIRRLVNQSAILQAQSQIAQQRLVHARPIEESAFGLRVGKGNTGSRICDWAEHQRAAAS
jgi:hypothetical protein